MTRGVRAISSGLMLLLSVVVGVGVFEVALRVVRPAGLSYRQIPCIYERDWGLGYRYATNVEGRLFEQHVIENIVETNALGFHDVEHDLDRHEGSMRVAIVGDSMTAAIQVPIEQVWTRVLERELRGAGRGDIEIVNMGIDGVGTATHLAMLYRYLPFIQPDVVVLAFYRNDFHDAYDKRMYRECYKGYVITYQDFRQKKQIVDYVDSHQPGKWLSWLYRHSYIFRAAAVVNKDWAMLRTNYLSPSRIGPKVNPKALDTPDIDDIFEQFLYLARRDGFRFLVMPVPDKKVADDSLSIYETVVPESIREEIPVVDTLPALRELLRAEGADHPDLYWRDDGHFNAYGNEVFGRAAAAALSGQITRPQWTEMGGGAVNQVTLQPERR
jgi:lysophospholipase L1-like esterase